MREKIIVADSSILICFAAAKKLSLLKKLAGKLIIPQAVYEEIAVKGKPGEYEVMASDWIEVKAIKGIEEMQKLPQHLGRGEKEAIALAGEIDGFLLIDDPSGRREAERQGIEFVGTLGILQEAQAKRVIYKIKPILDELITSGLRIHPKLYKEFLEKIGE